MAKTMDWGDIPDSKPPFVDDLHKAAVEQAVLDFLKAGPRTTVDLYKALERQSFPMSDGSQKEASTAHVRMAVRHHEKRGTIKITVDGNGVEILSLA
jgi:hypothetical protein